MYPSHTFGERLSWARETSHSEELYEPDCHQEGPLPLLPPHPPVGSQGSAVERMRSRGGVSYFTPALGSGLRPSCWGLGTAPWSLNAFAPCLGL